MAMRTASPWWVSLVLGVGLLFMFLGERLFGHESGLRGGLTLIGVVLVIAVTGVRAWTTVSSTGRRRRVEWILLLCHIATLVALVLYALTTNWGMTKLTLDEQTATRFSGAVSVLWASLLVASLVPVLMIELALGQALRTSFDLSPDQDDGVELLRVRDVSWSGLSVALALAFLMVTCNVAKQRNVQRDVSYFKTSSPGQSSKNIAKATSDPIKVLLFFPQVNEVKEQVREYFEELAKAAPGKITIEEHDRLVDAELAGKYKVQKDGVIVLVRAKPAAEKPADKPADKPKEGEPPAPDEKSQTLDIDTDLEKARKGAGKLRNLDREINSALMKLVREKRKAYVMAGHGEINDPDSIPPDLKGRIQERRTTVFKRRLGELNYEVKELGLAGLTAGVPDDATVVIMLAPTIGLQPAEWDALAKYLDGGGRLLIALDPQGDPSLGPLEGKLGVRYNPNDLTEDDPKHFMAQRGTLADRRWVVTTQFSAHASTTSLSRAADNGLVVLDSGVIEDVPFAPGATAPTKTVTIRSMETAFVDLNDNFGFDAATEKRQKWSIATAIEGPKVKGADGAEKEGFRALVVADVDLFADVVVTVAGRMALTMISPFLLDDAVRWLGGEEVFSGEVITEDDKPIKHTKNQDAKWFTLTIVGGPLVVLILGLVGTWARRRRAKSAVEVKP